MKISTYACEVCSIQKQPSNNWWKVYLMEGGGALLLPWEVERMQTDVDAANAHLCGQKCILEWLSRSVLEVKA